MKSRALIKIRSSARLSIKIRAIFELSIAGILWGFGFIGTVWALRFLSPSAIVFYRFFGAFAVGLIYLLLRRTPFAILKSEARLSLIPGVILWFSLYTQTWGLQSTTATNSTFITTLYVVLVPLFNWISKKEELHLIHWFCVSLALLGTAMIVEIQTFSGLNGGDLLTFFCAIFAAAHIISVGKRAPRSQNDFAFNVFQSLWISGLALLLFPVSEKWSLEAMDQNAWVGLFMLTFGASLIAFFLQVRSQKKISPSVASLLFLLESPAACFFSYWLLNERMNAIQWSGAGLILFACGIISLIPPKQPRVLP